MKAKQILIGVGLAAATLSSASGFAQDHGGPQGSHPGPNGYVHHSEWHKGARMNDGDWHRGAPVDYRSHHLHAPPRGYQWREVDGNYVLAAAATGLIASVIQASASR